MTTGHAASPSASPTATSSVELAEGLRVVAHRLAYALRRPDPEADISPTRYTALSTLSKHESLRPGDLAAIIGVSRASMSRIADVMVEGGWVTREPDPDDGRAHLLRISDHGRAVVAAVRRKAADDLRTGIEALEESDRRAVEIALPVLLGLADAQMERLRDR
jgi:DNA-binding MarR family transcriptional regulator